MRTFVMRLLITAFGLWAADAVLDGIHFDGVTSLWLAALLLGLANAVIRPIVLLLTLPFTLLTLGLFIFVINGLMVLLVASLMPTFHTTGLPSAIAASLIVGLTGWLANAFLGDKKVIEVGVTRGPR